MLLAPADSSVLVVRGGCFGARVVVLCCERVPRAALRRLPDVRAADFFGAGGNGRGADAAKQMALRPLPYDELRVACTFDGRLPRQRSARRPSPRANGSEQMANVLMGRHESTPLTGAHVADVGQHVILPEGSINALVGGVAALAKEQRFKLVHGVLEESAAHWRLAFEEELSDGPSSAAEALQVFSVAQDVLRDHAVLPSFRSYARGGPRFAAVQGDVDGGAEAVARVLVAMQEACTAVPIVAQQTG
jgi:hypothetical protein